MSDVTRFAIAIIGIGGLVWLIQASWQNSVRWVGQRGYMLGLSRRRQTVWVSITKVLGPISSLLFLFFNPGETASAGQAVEWDVGELPTERYEAPTKPVDNTRTVPPDTEFRLVVVKNRSGKAPKVGKTYPLVDGIHSIGRKPTPENNVTDIAIEEDHAISRDHIYLEAQADGTFSVTDRSSRHGTRLNGHRLEADRRYPFKVGDTLQIGNTYLALKQEGDSAEPVQKAKPAQFRLRVIDGQDKGKTLSITDKKVVIGRSNDADWHLRDEKVSRHHAEFRQEGAQFLIKDLDSTHGMYVNDLLIETRVLVPGDIIKLGETKLVFETV